MRREAVNAPATGKPQDVGFEIALGMNQAGAEVLSQVIERASPTLALIEILDTGVLVARTDVDIGPVDGGCLEHGITGIAIP